MKRVFANGQSIPGIQNLYTDPLYLGDTRRSALHLRLAQALSPEDLAALLSGEITVGEGEHTTTHEGYNLVHDCRLTLIRADDTELALAELNGRLAAAKSEQAETQAALSASQGAKLLLARVLSPRLTDAEALSYAPVWPLWQAETAYGAEEVLRHGGALYRVVQVHAAQAHQQPGGEGMLALYRPIVEDAAGTQADPIAFIYGMDVEEGKYYRYESALYLAKASLPACAWTPDTPGLWQWEQVEA